MRDHDHGDLSEYDVQGIGNLERNSMGDIRWGALHARPRSGGGMGGDNCPDVLVSEYGTNIL